MMTEYDASDNQLPAVVSTGRGNNPRPRPAFMVHITCVGKLNGQELTVSASVDLRHLVAFTLRLQEMGFRGPVEVMKYDHTADGLPICPKHRVPMKPRGKQGDKWHSHQVKSSDGFESYCKGYEGADSLGWKYEQPQEESSGSSHVER